MLTEEVLQKLRLLVFVTELPNAEWDRQARELLASCSAPDRVALAAEFERWRVEAETNYDHQMDSIRGFFFDLGQSAGPLLEPPGCSGVVRAENFGNRAAINRAERLHALVTAAK